MFYKLLGYVVWNGALWFVRHKYGNLLPSRRVASAGLVGIAVVGLAVVAARRDSLGDD